MKLDDTDDEKLVLSIRYTNISAEKYCKATKNNLKKFSNYRMCFTLYRMMEGDIPFHGYIIITPKKDLNFAKELYEAKNELVGYNHVGQYLQEVYATRKRHNIVKRVI